MAKFEQKNTFHAKYWTTTNVTAPIVTTFCSTVCLQTSDRDFTVTLSPPELLGRFSSFLFLTTRLIELHR